MSKFFGDDIGVQFWELVSHFVKKYSSRKTEKKEEKPQISQSTQLLDILLPAEVNVCNEEEKEEKGPEVSQSFDFLCKVEETLPVHFSLLRSGEDIKRSERTRATCFEGCRPKENLGLAEKSVKLHLYLNEKAKAVEILQCTPPEDPLFYQNALKACLIASTMHKDLFESSVKKAATQLVSHSMVDKGVELLCLIGAQEDACRHLQNAERWRDASWLAKVSLPEDHCAHIMKDWALLLQNMDNRQEAIEVFLSLGEFGLVLELLSKMKLIEQGAMLALALEEAGMFDPISQQLLDKDTKVTVEKLVQEIFLEYGMTLFSRLGNEEAAVFCWQRAGIKGKTMLQTTSDIKTPPTVRANLTSNNLISF